MKREQCAEITLRISDMRGMHFETLALFDIPSDVSVSLMCRCYARYFAVLWTWYVSYLSLRESLSCFDVQKNCYSFRGEISSGRRTFDSFDFLPFAYGGVFLDFNRSFFLRFLLESKRFQSIVVDAIQSSFSWSKNYNELPILEFEEWFSER